MSNFAKNAWCLFFALLYFGIWAIPMILGVALVYILIMHYKPQWLEK